MFSGGFDLQVMRGSMNTAMALAKRFNIGSEDAVVSLSCDSSLQWSCGCQGASLLLAADYRIGVDGAFKIGLNEVAIGMTMPHGGVELARGRLAPVFFNRSVILAEMFSPKEAVIAGFLDKVVSEVEFVPRVQAIALAMTKLDMKAHHHTKLKVRAELLQVLDECIEKDRHGSL
ncbi:enoyl-CoA hydratase [Paraglaciecola psychrophila 170]|nr:enoyl-CoA hydratase [Paraglaciecola psychrophila 170]